MRKIILTKEDILKSQKHTLSNKAAARYLGVSYNTYKRYARLYVDTETGESLFDKHLNPSGKGIRKLGVFGNNRDINNVALRDVLEGRVDISHYSVDNLKARLIHEGFLPEECTSCGFSERRVVDYRVPLVLNFKDKNKRNWKSENLEFLCYNCYFLHVGNIWSDNQLQQMEDYEMDANKWHKDESPSWELDENHIEHLKNLGLWDSPDNEEDEFIDKY